MLKQVKDVRKSIRLSQDVEKYISSFGGTGFQEQFDNMIHFFKDQEPLFKERLDNLSSMIAFQDKRLQERWDFFDKTLDIVDLCQEFSRASQMLRDQVNRIISDQSAFPDMSQDTLPFGKNTA